MSRIKFSFASVWVVSLPGPVLKISLRFPLTPKTEAERVCVARQTGLAFCRR